uniref:50S ribosomal protein L18 n=1 Tax=Arundo donax TaxID=35708 RepID=A0A0A9BTI1_ARUDO
MVLNGTIAKSIKGLCIAECLFCVKRIGNVHLSP